MAFGIKITGGKTKEIWSLQGDENGCVVVSNSAITADNDPS